ncbi:MAG TPA: AAA family ATPase [Longimicrobium sp.]|nr:AAA family ATPase [Longimicrobium sp.]
MIPRIREVHLRNYRSIRQAVVRLSDLTVLVGPNGSGKSNFMDALAFVQECLSSSIEAALRRRGSLFQVCYGAAQLTGNGVGIRFLIELAAETVVDYAFEVVSREGGGIEVAEERCIISERGKETHRFEVRGGGFVTPIPGLRAALEPDRLALYAASALEEFRPLYDFLVGIRMYSVQPESIRDLREPGPSTVLDPDGGNAAAVLDHLRKSFPDRFERVRSLLEAVVPGIELVEGATVGGRQFLLFKDRAGPPGFHKPLYPANVSDGTLRMIGLLLAVYQPATPSVLLIEEPEATIHPAAVDVVMSVLLDAAKRSQVVVTTHSPDVLDQKSLPAASLRVVARTDHGTAIAPVAVASREAIRERLYTPGELLRTDELNVDALAAESLAQEARLFGDPVHSFEGAA